MKVYTASGVSTDRIAPKMPLISEFVRKYRHMSGPRSLTEETAVARPLSLRAEDRQSELVSFYRLYEDFVESLCDGVQFGVSRSLEEKYQSSRSELVQRYSTLRPFVGAFIRPSRDDSGRVVRGLKVDAFDSLLEPPTLEMFLLADDGNTISRITRTREALNLYGEHMRHLAKKMK